MGHLKPHQIPSISLFMLYCQTNKFVNNSARKFVLFMIELGIGRCRFLLIRSDTDIKQTDPIPIPKQV
jgi:hypothetical protein